MMLPAPPATRPAITPALRCAAALIVLALPAAIKAQTRAQPAAYASLTAIDRAVAAFTGADIGLPGGATLPVDRRLRLRACEAPLELTWRGARHDTVVVQCPDAGSWHLFVPVRGQAAQAGGNAVDRGDQVTIAVTGDGFSVSQPGEAVDAGTVGDWVRVRAVKDGALRSEMMRARVVRPGEVEVLLP